MPDNTSIVQLIFWLAGGTVTAVIGFIGLRYTTRSAIRASSADLNARWNARFRSVAERHIHWDVQMRFDHLVLRSKISDLEIKLGMPLTVWDELPPPPPLFPSEIEEKDGN